ncbi:GntR family transcriptional regulator [Amycolatopsis sp. OK19-0408]|uniref:GntR family transcriptional regulator n=1 Tax=Amycolatopsis iheyensis TaxID=2945988 RepID=A0A9X2SRD1_9PSEU|nr:GntR family transcriptional regulator [Amycolatopsis iheyensis]MCR6489880.1 GntR family transcriptional regulator [Amycolatopsis iheyensis]
MNSVYEDVRGLIVHGTYPAGQAVTEQELCDRLGVSRTPVREALRRLEGDGLVEPARRGVTVVELDSKALRDDYLVRAALEGLTAELAAARQRSGELAPAELTRLEKLAAEADQATRKGDFAAGVRHNRAFHGYIAALAENPPAVEVLDRIWDRIIVSTRASLTAPVRTGQVGEEHKHLVAAIAGGRAEDAAFLARQHVLSTMYALEGAGK